MKNDALKLGNLREFAKGWKVNGHGYALVTSILFCKIYLWRLKITDKYNIIITDNPLIKKQLNVII